VVLYDALIDPAMLKLALPGRAALTSANAADATR
jgi:hypothetical protein